MYDDNIIATLENEIKKLKDEITIMKREYDDILSNIDYDNLSEQLARDIRGE